MPVASGAPAAFCLPRGTPQAVLPDIALTLAEVGPHMAPQALGAFLILDKALEESASRSFRRRRNLSLIFSADLLPHGGRWLTLSRYCSGTSARKIAQETQSQPHQVGGYRTICDSGTLTFDQHDTAKKLGTRLADWFSALSKGFDQVVQQFASVLGSGVGTLIGRNLKR